MELYSPGLRGVCAGETELVSTDGPLRIRGYLARDLVDDSSFLETAFLMLLGELPTQEEFADFCSILDEEATLPAEVLVAMEQLPLHLTAAQWLHACCGVLTANDPEVSDPRPQACLAQIVRILARLPLVLAAHNRTTPRGEALLGDGEMGYAATLLNWLTGEEPTTTRERAFDALLMVQAMRPFETPHFASRVIASAGGDMYTSIAAGLGITAMGPSSHFQAAWDFLDLIETADDGERWRLNRQPVGDAHADAPCRAGFTTLQRDRSPLAGWLLKRHIEKLAMERDLLAREEASEAVERAWFQESKLVPHIDWMSARLLHYLGVTKEQGWAIVVFGRVLGWCAHAWEQREEASEPYTPLARYRGPESLPFVPLAIRG